MKVLIEAILFLVALIVCIFIMLAGSIFFHFSP